ncbi:hypothetical protein E2562_005276, partial [Oryza meyeriana var. granulata]
MAGVEMWISCGLFHSMVLVDGGVMVDFGALGHYVYHRDLLPRQVSGPWEWKISHIATSGAHIAAIIDS